MLGGYQILDLRKIDLTITKTQSNITNAYVLSQLLKLRDFIDKDYDFSKPIENQLKPVLIRYRDKKNGEKSEGAMFGELAVVDNYYTFKITGRISGALILTIKVVFEEITNAYGAKEWVISSAKIQLQDVLEDLEGNLALEGDLDVSGDLDVGGDAEVTGDASVGGDLVVTGSINNEENPSVKPIYCHPIQIERVEDNIQTAELTMLIFNNSATAFTKTTFLNWLDDLFSTVGSTIRIMASGGWKSSGALMVASYIGKYGANNYYLMGIASSGNASIETLTREEMEEFITSLTDGVNKIN